MQKQPNIMTETDSINPKNRVSEGFPAVARMVGQMYRH
jgi:hypothetical protein